MEFILCFLLGCFFTYLIFKKPKNVLPSKFQRMSPAALHDLYQEYESEMDFWSKVLTVEIQSVGLSDRVQHFWFSKECVIIRMKKIAVWRMDALEDLMEEIKSVRWNYLPGDAAQDYTPIVIK